MSISTDSRVAINAHVHFACRLSFEDFCTLLNRMLRTGHFTASSIIRQTQYVPVEWSILSGQGIAEVFYERLDRPHDEPISFAEFKQEALAEAEQGTVKLWYLLPRRKRRKKKKKSFMGDVANVEQKTNETGPTDSAGAPQSADVVAESTSPSVVSNSSNAN